MSAENVAAVRAYYDAFNRGDHESAYAFLAEDFVADYSRRSIEAGIARGREQAIAVAEAVREAWGELSVEPEELIERGNRVIAVVANRARGAVSGAEIGARTAQVWTLRDGKAVRFEYFGSREEALEATGPGEP
jgi:ketosteroid isomerase-like protein